MAEKNVNLPNVGQEMERPDLNLAVATAALADDRVLAELLRILPYDGGAQGIYKAILGYSSSPAGTGEAPSPGPVVVPTGSANGSVQVNPFRAIVGSRNLVGAAPSPNPTSDTNALCNWRDVRSGIFTGSATTLSTALSIAANASGNPRWDLIYATVAVDAGQNTVVRRVKDPTSGSISTPSVPQYLLSPVTVQVLTGTPGATPSLPTLPADSAGNYNLALSAVRVPNGFTSTSTVATTDLRSLTLGNNGQPSGPFRDLTSGFRVAAASGNNDSKGTYAIRSAFQWNAASGGRPGVFLPPDWLGGAMRIVEIDCTDPSSANWSHNDGDVVDDSIDWRDRMFLVHVQDGLSNHPFANDHTNQQKDLIPEAGGSSGIYAAFYHAPRFNMGQSFFSDGAPTGSGSGSFVSYQPGGAGTAIQSGAQINLWVDLTTGLLKCNIIGTPSARIIFWVMTTGAYPNY